jgi:CDP-6-deoxy-D-xylo-4-hexulose-3-dehydrase
MYDVLIDLRKGSPTFKKWESYVLKNDQKYVYVPAGVAHGYVSMEDNTLTLYYKGAVYDPAKEINVNALDPSLGITWPAPIGGMTEYVMSEKDRNLPSLDEVIAGRPDLNIDHKKVWYAPNKFEAYGEEEIQSVLECLRDGWLAPGPRTSEFEKVVSAYFGKKFGIFCNSGSSANVLALHMAGLKPTDEVITPVCTFSTVVAPLCQLKLIPVFCDVQLRTFVPSVSQIMEKVSKKTKAIFIPNLAGSKPDWAGLKQACIQIGRSDIVLIEDSCDTMTLTNDSDISVTSFYASHVITAGGGGGMVMCNDQELLKTGFTYRD